MGSRYLVANIRTFEQCSVIRTRIGNTQDISHNFYKILQIFNDSRNGTLCVNWQNQGFFHYMNCLWIVDMTTFS